MWHTLLSWQDLQQCHEYEFSLDSNGTELSGFVIHYEGEVFAYHNRCPHQQVFLNWSPHQFYDREKRFLMCSTHGALFKADNGLCVQGPCGGQSLQAINARINEAQVQVYIGPEPSGNRLHLG